jgi:glycosyltransferase involved in cell wall biosynthesis
MTNDHHGLPKTMSVGNSTQKLRIAFVYGRLPFPMMRGDQLTVAHLLSFFHARGHAVDFFTLDAGGHASEAQMAWLREVCRNVRIYRHGTTWKALGVLRGLFSGLPMQVGIFNNSSLKCDVKAGIDQGLYDIVYVYYLRSAEMVPHRAEVAKLDHQPATILAMQLSQTLNTRRIYENQSGLLKKSLYLFELTLLRRYETRIWQQFTRTALIGPRDVEAIQEECRRQNVREIDNWFYGAHGTDISKFTSAKPEEIVPGRVVFSGSMLYAPNVQAVLWFVENCWPTIHSRFPDSEFVIQGRDPVPEITRLHGKDRIVVTGTVPDVSAIIRSASVCINPMHAAGGMQNKLIEYFACAKRVVATAVANEGIGATPGKHFLEANTPEEFSQAVIMLLQDETNQDELGSQSRRFVAQRWTWEAHFLELEKEFFSALATVVNTNTPVVKHSSSGSPSNTISMVERQQ